MQVWCPKFGVLTQRDENAARSILWRLGMGVVDALHEGRAVLEDGFWRAAKRALAEVRRFYRLRRARECWEARGLPGRWLGPGPRPMAEKTSLL